MEVKLDFTNDEMKNFILKTGKYKITNVKSLSWGFLQGTEAIIEVAYPIDDIETENWIMSVGVQPTHVFDHFSILSVFHKEFKSKLLNL
jgi:hypothetical protein